MRDPFTKPASEPKTLDEIHLGYLGAVQEAVGLLMLGIGAYVARRYRRRTMMGSGGIRLAPYGALWVLALLRALSFTLLLGLVLVAERAGSVFAPSSFARLPQMAERTELPLPRRDSVAGRSAGTSSPPWGSRLLLVNAAHRSVQDLGADLRAWLATWNAPPPPYMWIKTADQIPVSLKSYCQRIPNQ